MLHWFLLFVFIIIANSVGCPMTIPHKERMRMTWSKALASYQHIWHKHKKVMILINRFSKRDLPYFNLYHRPSTASEKRPFTELGLLECVSLYRRSISVSKNNYTFFFQTKQPLLCRHFVFSYPNPSIINDKFQLYNYLTPT